MERQLLKMNLYVFVVLITFCSCANLRSVNKFSSASSDALSKFEDVNYGFNQHCLESCEMENIRQFQIKRLQECDCAIYKKADSVTMLIYLSIKNYFEALRTFSDKDLTHYDFTALNTSLVTGSFGDIKIDQQQADAYTGISNILLNAATGKYRKKKIKKYVQQANPSLQVLLDKFEFILQKNLEGELDFKKEKLYDFYRELLLTTGLNNYEKQKAATEYYQQIDAINNEKEKINFLTNSLSDIANGHQELFNNSNRMKDNKLKDSLLIYESAIQKNISQFNKIKN